MSNSPKKRIEPTVYTVETVDIDIYDNDNEQSNYHNQKPHYVEKEITPYREQVNNNQTDLNPLDKLTLSTEVSIRYHQRRKNHYDHIYKVMAFVVIMMATSGFILNLAQSEIYILGTVAVIGLMLVWNLNQKSREHEVLRHRYQNLLEQIRMKQNPEQSDLYDWRTTRIKIQADEPPMHWALVNDCYYDVARSWDLRPKNKACPIWLRPFMNWFRF